MKKATRQGGFYVANFPILGYYITILQKGAVVMKRSLLEMGKTALIVILLISLVLLFAASIPSDVVRNTPWLSTVLKPIGPLLGLPAAELAYVAEAQSVQTAAQPLTISIRNQAGRYTAQWDFTALDTAYETLGGLLGQALDTAEAFTEARQFQLTQALSKPSICFDYGFELPATLAASWLDADCPADETAGSMFVLARESDQIWLYVSGSTCRRAVTQVNPAEFTALLDQFSPDGSQFAFEANSHLEPLSILPGSVPQLMGAQTESLHSNRYVDALANNLGFNPYDAGRYTDSTGTTHFSESGGSLKISTNGQLDFTASTARITASGTSPETLVETARSLLAMAVDPVALSARLYLSGFTQEGEETTCTFDYVLRGVPVRWADGPAATVVFSGQTVTKLHVNAVNFSFTDQVQHLLPPVQTAAILPKDGRLQLQYHVSGSDAAAGWNKQ